MEKILVILVIVASVGYIRCQNAAGDNIECPFGTVKYGTSCFPPGRRYDAGCPPGKERELLTGECVEVIETRRTANPRSWFGGCINGTFRVGDRCVMPVRRNEDQETSKVCCPRGTDVCYLSPGGCIDETDSKEKNNAEK